MLAVNCMRNCTVDSQRSLAPRHEASTGTKLSQHAAQRDHPVQNSPRTHKNADFGPLSAHRENLFTLTPITSHAGRTLYRTRGRCRYKTLPAHRPGGITRYKTLPARGPVGPTRYKTLPARGLVGPTRYKTLPARHKTHTSAHFPGAGRILSRSGCKQTTQGDLCTAFGACAGTKLSQLAPPAGPPGTKLSQHVPPAGDTGTKLSRHAPKRRFRPTLRQQGEFCTASTTTKPSREKKVTHQHPTSPHQRSPPQFRT